MKKVFALLLTLVMVLSLIPATALAAGPEVINGVSVNGTLPELTVGDTLQDVTMTVPQTANYTVSTVWHNDETGEVAPGTVTAAGKAYDLWIKLEAKSGYCFKTEYWDMPILLNGAPAENYMAETDSNSNAVIGIVICVHYTFKEMIDKVEINFEEPQAGKAAPAITIPENVNYELAANYSGWTDGNGQPVTELVKGKIYNLFVELIPKAGYEFSDDVDVLVNGVQDGQNSYSDYNYVDLQRSYSFLEMIDKVEISYAVPEVGKALPEIKVPENANYELETSTGWYDITWNNVTTIEAGGVYWADVYVQPKDGYEFSDDVEVLVNGAASQNENITDDWINVWDRYSLKTLIDKVEISYAAPEVGKPLPEIKIPENVGYELIAYTGWYSDTWGNVTAIEDGKAYWADVYVQPKDGYEFSDDVEVLVNGAASQNETISYDSINVWDRYSFKKQITSIDLPALPETLKAGDATANQTLPTPSGANYTLEQQWMKRTAGGFDPAGAVAEAGNVYAGAVVAIAADGCEFSDDVVVTVGGKTVESLLLTVEYDGVAYGQLYVLDDTKIIDKVEITAGGPVIGEKPGESTVPANAGYALNYADWGVSDKDDWSDAKPLRGAYAEGDYAWLMASLVAEEGYIFSPEMEVYINGKKIELKQQENCYYDFDTLELLVGFGKLEVVKPGAPATGDDTNLVLWGVLLTVSALGAAIVLSRKQKKA